MSPATLASSIPSPTNPLRAGSCPEPPIVITATLSRDFGTARTTIRPSSSLILSGYAPASPSRSSSVRFSGEFRNFFIFIISGNVEVLPISGIHALECKTLFLQSRDLSTFFIKILSFYILNKTIKTNSPPPLKNLRFALSSAPKADNSVIIMPRTVKQCGKPFYIGRKFRGPAKNFSRAKRPSDAGLHAARE